MVEIKTGFDRALHAGMAERVQTGTTYVDTRAPQVGRSHAHYVVLDRGEGRTNTAEDECHGRNLPRTQLIRHKQQKHRVVAPADVALAADDG
jgi:hypothetical protein